MRKADASRERGKWAACSGSIETTDTSPEEAAKREIREETTLTDADITLLRRGKPFSLIDEGLKTQWTIHPFAWMMKPGSRDIIFDWEHTEYKFIRPQDFKDYETVPNLEFGMKRCFVGPETEKALNVLRDDHESGAQAMATIALNMLLKAVRGADLVHYAGGEEYWKELKIVAWHLAKNGRPSMGAAIEAGLFKVLENIRGKLEDTDLLDLDAESVKFFAEAAIEKAITSRKGSLEAVANNLVDLVAKEMEAPLTTIVTLSSSGTIKKSLQHLIWNLASKGKSMKLCVLESRPNFEGVSFVNTLLEELEMRGGEKEQNRNLETLTSCLKIDIIPDANVGMAVKSADYVLLGADKVLPNGDTSNKIGSLAAAVTAKSLNPACKVVAVFETDKITGSGESVEHLKVEYNDEAEVTRAWPSQVLSGLTTQRSAGLRIMVNNVYFEWVPAKYIDYYVSERRVLALDEIRQLSIESEELEKRIFSRDFK